MELQIIKNEKEIRIINFDRIKEYLSNSLSKYKDIVYDEYSVNIAKKDRAKLNKLVKAFEDKRKALKKECLKPYEDFERKIKELNGLIKEPIEQIEASLEKHEKIRINEKEDEVDELIGKYAPEYIFDIPYLKEYNKWLNKTCITATITKEIKEIKNKIDKDLEILYNTHNLLDMPYLESVENIYFSTNLNLAKALEDEKMRREEREQFLKRQEIIKRQEDEKRKELEKESNLDTRKQTIDTKTGEILEKITKIFSVTATKKKLIELYNFMKEGNYTFTEKI